MLMNLAKQENVHQFNIIGCITPCLSIINDDTDHINFTVI